MEMGREGRERMNDREIQIERDEKDIHSDIDKHA